MAVAISALPQGECKRCSKCGEVKPLDHFRRETRKGKGCSHGRRSSCRVCWAAEVRGRVVSKVTGFRITSPEHAARMVEIRAERAATESSRRQEERRRGLEQYHERYRNDPAYREAMLEKSRQRYRANVERERERVRHYKHANPAKASAWGCKRWKRATQASDGTLTASQVRQALRSRRTCPYCLTKITPETAHLDHIIALSRGGIHGLVNVVPCCSTCNARKNAKPFDEWVAMLDERGRESALRLYRERYGAEPEQAQLL